MPLLWIFRALIQRREGAEPVTGFSTHLIRNRHYPDAHWAAGKTKYGLARVVALLGVPTTLIVVWFLFNHL
jgi:hypothetical protein